MGNWQGLDCDCNNFDGLLNILEACQPQCKNVEKNIECCYAKCILIDHYMFNGGKANKTAISSLFGTAGDSKVIKNFEECEAIGKEFTQEVYYFYSNFVSKLRKDHLQK